MTVVEIASTVECGFVLDAGNGEEAARNPLVLEAMIAAALLRCKAIGIQMMEVVGFAGQIRSRLERIAPFRRKLSSWLFYYKAVAKELKIPLQNPQLWQPCGYDGDSSL